MAKYADPMAYDMVIGEIRKFIQAIQDNYEYMLQATQVCVDNLEGDKSSLVAQKNIVLCGKRYQAVVEMAQDLIQKLEAEKEAILELYRNELSDDDDI